MALIGRTEEEACRRVTVGLGKNFATPWLARPSAALDVRPASRPLSRIVVRRGHRVLSPVRPNAGIEAVYAARLAALLRDVDASVRYWVGSAYRRAEPQLDLLIGSMAADAATADLEKVLRALRRRWEPKFNQLARDLAQYFVTKAADRSDAELKKLLKRAGFTVEFKLTAPVREVMRATVAENVSLIRSIPQQYLTRVEGAVMRSVVAGRDLKSLTDEHRADAWNRLRRLHDTDLLIGFKKLDWPRGPLGSWVLFSRGEWAYRAQWDKGQPDLWELGAGRGALWIEEIRDRAHIAEMARRPG